MAHIEATPRIETAVINAYIRKKIEPIYREDKFLAMLKGRGRISHNNHGKLTDWKVKFRRRELGGGGDGNPVSISFPRVNRRKTAQLPWRNYNLGESLTKYEKLVSQNSETALFKLAEEVVDDLASDFREGFRFKLYLDGNLAANAKDIHGLESFYGDTGSVITDSAAVDPSDTYAGLSTVLGAAGGDWSPNTGDGWPTGTANPAEGTEYNYFSPLIVDYHSRKFTNSTTWNFKNTWQQAIRYLTTNLGNLQRQEPDLILLNPALLNQARDSLESVQRFEVTQTGSTYLTKIGHKTLQFEGTEMASEYGVPDAVGYALAFDKMELKSMQGQLFGRMSDMDITTAEDLFAVDFYGNLCVESPAFFGKLKAVAAAGT